MAERELAGLVGIYHADGGVRGELSYVLGKLLGTAHCALCDVTHSGVRRRPAWDRMVVSLGVPVDLQHLNEMPREVAAVVGVHGSPAVLARAEDNDWEPLLGAAELDVMAGSLTAFEESLRAALDRDGWRLPSARSSG